MELGACSWLALRVGKRIVVNGRLAKLLFFSLDNLTVEIAGNEVVIGRPAVQTLEDPVDAEPALPYGRGKA